MESDSDSSTKPTWSFKNTEKLIKRVGKYPSLWSIGIRFDANLKKKSKKVAYKMGLPWVECRRKMSRLKTYYDKLCRSEGNTSWPYFRLMSENYKPYERPTEIMPRMNHESKKSVFMGYRGVPWPKYDVKPSMETLNYNRRSYYTDAGAPKQSTERFNYDRRMDYAGTSSGSRYEYTPHNSFIQPPPQRSQPSQPPNINRAYTYGNDLYSTTIKNIHHKLVEIEAKHGTVRAQVASFKLLKMVDELEENMADEPHN